MTAARRFLQASSLGCAALFAPVAALGIEGFDLPRELALSCGALFALAALGSARQPRSAAGLADRLLLATCALAALSACLGVNGFIGLRATLFWLGCVATFTAARALAAEGHAEALLQAAGLGVLLVAASVLGEAFGLFSWSLPGRAPGGLLGHRNYAAHFLALGLPLLLWLFVAQGRRLALAALVLAAAALAITRCRTAWIGAALALVVFAVWLRAAPRARAAAVALAAGVAFAVLVPNRLAWGSGHPYLETLASLTDLRSGSGGGRLAQARVTLAMIAAHPLLGVGPGGWTVEYSGFAPPGDPTVQPMRMWQTPLRATSDWLGLTAERGVPAALLLLAALALLARAALRDDDRPRGAALLALLAAALPMTLFDCPLQVAAPAQLFFLCAGALAPPAQGPPWRLPRALRGALAALGCGALLFLAAQLAAGVLIGRPTMEERELAARLAPGNPRLQVLAAASWLERGQPARCVPLAERALRISPGFQLAQALAQQCRARSQGAR